VQVGQTETVVDGVSIAFGSNNFAHPRGSELKRMCGEITKRIAAVGHCPDVSWATRRGSKEARTQSLSYHSERIAIAWNLLVTPPGTPIRLTKNLRVCGDCHAATKFIAAVYGRVIEVRDKSRWHVFGTDGKCSCGDYF
jgi:hypothetical protein